jgi:uncharacterized surface protein with fasciclin (FAS1) repeats
VADPFQSYTQYATFAECFKQAGLTNTSAMIKAAGSDRTLSNPNITFTILAPTDAAWAELAAASRTTVSAMTRNPFLARNLVFYHMVPGAYLATILKNNDKVKTLLPAFGLNSYRDLTVLRDTTKNELGFKGMGSTALVLRPNMICGKGVAHSINRVLLPMNTGATS